MISDKLVKKIVVSTVFCCVVVFTMALGKGISEEIKDANEQLDTALKDNVKVDIIQADKETEDKRAPLNEIRYRYYKARVIEFMLKKHQDDSWQNENEIIIDIFPFNTKLRLDVSKDQIKQKIGIDLDDDRYLKASSLINDKVISNHKNLKIEVYEVDDLSANDPLLKYEITDINYDSFSYLPATDEEKELMVLASDRKIYITFNNSEVYVKIAIFEGDFLSNKYSIDNEEYDYY